MFQLRAGPPPPPPGGVGVGGRGRAPRPPCGPVALWSCGHVVLSGCGLHCIALNCMELHCIALHCIALHCVALRCIALHCLALHCICIIIRPLGAGPPQIPAPLAPPPHSQGWMRVGVGPGMLGSGIIYTQKTTF